jgi:dephospho-CoA kinase
VIDADRIARDVVEPGRPALAEIEVRFPGNLTPEGTLDRKKLAARVFASPDDLAALNAIVHPRIAEEVGRRLTLLREQGAPFALYEAALIVENGLHEGLDGLIVVAAPEDEQVRRVAERDALDAREVRARIAAQLPTSEKVAKASFVIDNSGTLESLAAQVDRVLARLQGEAK